MPAWLGKILYYVGGFLLEKAISYWRESQKIKADKKLAEAKREEARQEYLSVMKDPTKTQKEREDAFQRFLDRTRPRP